MLRFLLGVVLFEVAVLGVVVAARDVFDLRSAAHWQHEAFSARFEADRCEQKHVTLTKQIKREGLWDRLGMGGQPWLQ